MTRESAYRLTDAKSTPANCGYNSRRTKAILLASAVLSCAFASDGFAQSRENPQPKDNVLATLQLADGSIVQFNETAPGELVVSAQTRATDDGQPTVALGGVPIAVLDGLDAVGQYEALSGGAAAPPALVQAQARVESAMRTDAAPEEKAVHRLKVPARDNGIRPELTGNEFQSTYCPTSGYSFNFCWLYRTGTSWVQRGSASYIQSTVNPYRGNVMHKLEYRSCGLFSCSWHDQISRSVLEGYVGWIWASGSSRGRRATVYEANGDGYHVAYFGNN